MQGNGKSESPYGKIFIEIKVVLYAVFEKLGFVLCLCAHARAHVYVRVVWWWWWGGAERDRSALLVSLVRLYDMHAHAQYNYVSN